MSMRHTSLLLLVALASCTPAPPPAAPAPPEFTAHDSLLGTDPTPLSTPLSLGNAVADDLRWDLVITETVSLQAEDTASNAQVERRVRIEGVPDPQGGLTFTLSKAQVFTGPTHPSWLASQAELLDGIQISMTRTAEKTTVTLPEDLAPVIAPHVRSIGLALELLMPPLLPERVSPDSTWTLTSDASPHTTRTIRPLGTTACDDRECLILASAVALSETRDESNDTHQVSAIGKGRGQAIVRVEIRTGIPVSGRMNYSVKTKIIARGEKLQATTLMQTRQVEVSLRNDKDRPR